MNLTVLVVDDEPLARLGVTARLRPHSDFTVVVSAAQAKRRSIR